jgi:tetratricopeptide (TPR) repeat protein
MIGLLKSFMGFFRGIVKVLIFGLILFFPSQGIEAGNAHSAESKAKLSDKEKKQLVERGVTAYETGHLDDAKELLIQAETAFPENFAVPYYLGLIYLVEGEKDRAILQWKRYIAMDTNSENEVKIRKYLTIMIREQARKRARSAVSQESADTPGPVKERTVAIAAFKDTGFEGFGPLGKGMAALLISDLSHVPGLEVVDRIEVQISLEEMGAGTFGLVDAAIIPRVGRLLKAGHVVTGCLSNSETKDLKVTCTVFHTLSNPRTSSLEAQGELTQFYDLEKDIACRIAADMGESCDKMPKAFHKVHTRSLAALVAYSWGLDYFDQGNYDKAHEMFQKALKEDPAFEPAEAALLATPTSAMQIQSASQMITDVSSSGIISAAAGNAMIGGKGKGGNRTTKIVGGLALIAGGVALAGGGGGVDDGPDPPPPLEVSGVWRGNWNESGNDVSFKLTIAQPDSSGNSIIADNSQCIATGIALISVDDPNVSLTVQSSTGNSFQWDGTCTQKDADNKCIEMDINWQTETVNAPCVSASGHFFTRKSGSTSISW